MTTFPKVQLVSERVSRRERYLLTLARLLRQIDRARVSECDFCSEDAVARAYAMNGEWKKVVER